MRAVCWGQKAKQYLLQFFKSILEDPDYLKLRYFGLFPPLLWMRGPQFLFSFYSAVSDRHPYWYASPSKHSQLSLKDYRREKISCFQVELLLNWKHERGSVPKGWYFMARSWSKSHKIQGVLKAYGIFPVLVWFSPGITLPIASTFCMK